MCLKSRNKSGVIAGKRMRRDVRGDVEGTCQITKSPTEYDTQFEF